MHAHHLRFGRTSEADAENRRLAIHDGAGIDGGRALIPRTPVANGGDSTTAARAAAPPQRTSVRNAMAAVRRAVLPGI